MLDPILPKHRPGFRLVGFGPRAGMQRDPDGRIMLVGWYEPIDKERFNELSKTQNQDEWKRLYQQQPVRPEPAPEPPARVQRGVKPVQGDLL